MSSFENETNYDPFEQDVYVSGTEPPTLDDFREYQAQLLSRYAEVVKRAGLPLNERGTVDWKAVVAEERAKLEKEADS